MNPSKIISCPHRTQTPHHIQNSLSASSIYIFTKTVTFCLRRRLYGAARSISFVPNRGEYLLGLAENSKVTLHNRRFTLIYTLTSPTYLVNGAQLRASRDGNSVTWIICALGQPDRKQCVMICVYGAVWSKCTKSSFCCFSVAPNLKGMNGLSAVFKW